MSSHARIDLVFIIHPTTGRIWHNAVVRWVRSQGKVHTHPALPKILSAPLAMNVALPFYFARENNPDQMASLILIGQNVPVEFQWLTNSRVRQCIRKCKSPRDLTVDRRTTETRSFCHKGFYNFSLIGKYFYNFE